MNRGSAGARSPRGFAARRAGVETGATELGSEDSHRPASEERKRSRGARIAAGSRMPPQDQDGDWPGWSPFGAGDVAANRTHARTQFLSSTSDAEVFP